MSRSKRTFVGLVIVCIAALAQNASFRPAGPLEFWGLDGELHLLESYRGRTVAVAILAEDQFESNRVAGLSQLQRTFKAQGLSVLGIVVPTKGEYRGLMERLKITKLRPDFALGPVSVAECRQFLGSGPGPCVADYPQLVQIDRLGRIRSIRYFSRENMESLLDVSLLVPDVPSTAGRQNPMQISPAAQDLYRRLVSASSISTADFTKQIKRVRVVAPGYESAAQRGVLAADLLVDSNARVSLKVTVEQHSAKFQESRTGGTYRGAFGVSLPSAGLYSQQEPATLMVISTTFSLPGVVLRETGFRRAELIPFTARHLSMAKSFSSEDVNIAIEQAVLAMVRAARATTDSTSNDSLWGQMIGDASQAEKLYASFSAARENSAPLTGLRAVRNVIGARTPLNLTIRLGSPTGPDVMYSVDSATMTIYLLSKTEATGFVHTIEVRDDFGLLSGSNGNLFRIAAATYVDHEVGFYPSSADIHLELKNKLVQKLNAAIEAAR